MRFEESSSMSYFGTLTDMSFTAIVIHSGEDLICRLVKCWMNSVRAWRWMHWDKRVWKREKRYIFCMYMILGKKYYVTSIFILLLTISHSCLSINDWLTSSFKFWYRRLLCNMDLMSKFDQLPWWTGGKKKKMNKMNIVKGYKESFSMFWFLFGQCCVDHIDEPWGVLCTCTFSCGSSHHMVLLSTAN